MNKESKIPVNRPVLQMVLTGLAVLSLIGFIFLYAWVAQLIQDDEIWWVQPTLFTIFIGGFINVVGIVWFLNSVVENWETDE